MKTVFAHALRMVRRNLRSYRLLSVTIVLSFSALLGYMLVTDSNIYNQYKTLFCQDPNLLTVWNCPVSETALLDRYEKKAKELDPELFSCRSYDCLCKLGGLYQTEDGRKVSLDTVMVHSVPIWSLWDRTNDVTIQWLDRGTHDGVSLLPGQALITDQLYYALGLDKTESPELRVNLENPATSAGQTHDLRLQIVGLIPSPEGSVLEFREDGIPTQRYAGTELVLSFTDWNPEAAPELIWFVTEELYSQKPLEVLELSRQMLPGRTARSAAQQQQDALKAIRTEKKTKAYIAMALFILLGINLYSSFANALNERKFEIGVKRAIGAAKWSIVRQFLYESLCLMLANILVSVWLVTAGLIAFKYVREHLPVESRLYCANWVIDFSPYSLAMSAVCAAGLTLVFSLIFAWRSTQVEIVRYLKAE